MSSNIHILSKTDLYLHKRKQLKYFLIEVGLILAFRRQQENT